jgi:RNA-directed DNA polymerase
MTVFARRVAAILLDGLQTESAMVARLVAAFGEHRRWMEPLVRALARTGEGLETADDEELDDEALDDEELDDEALDAEPSGDPWTVSLDELAARLLRMRSFRRAVLERPLERLFDGPPEMRESPWQVPALATAKELANWLGIAVDDVTALADLRGISTRARDPRRRHYRYRWVPKPGRESRLLEAPKPRLRSVQRYILDGILAPIPAHPAAHGFRAGRSVRSFAVPHVGQDVVIRVDLQAFFTSIFAARVAAIFRTAGYPPGVAYTLAGLCTHRTPVDVLHGRSSERNFGDAAARLRAPHLPQGAPTSGALANLAAYRLDVRVDGLARSLNARYTRYADDLVLSGGRPLLSAATTIVARIGAIAADEGFALNYRKTRVMTAAGRQRITGLIVNDKLGVPRREVERLRAILHNCVKTSPSDQNREGLADFRAHLLGRISWVTSIDSAKGTRLRAVFDRIRWD